MSNMGQCNSTTQAAPVTELAAKLKEFDDVHWDDSYAAGRTTFLCRQRNGELRYTRSAWSMENTYPSDKDGQDYVDDPTVRPLIHGFITQENPEFEEMRASTGNYDRQCVSTMQFMDHCRAHGYM